jgi:hypothetical protein
MSTKPRPAGVQERVQAERPRGGQQVRPKLAAVRGG